MFTAYSTQGQLKPRLILAEEFWDGLIQAAVYLACVAGVERGRGRGNLGARESVWGARGGKELGREGVRINAAKCTQTLSAAC